MMSFAAPILFTLFVWWLSTGAILYLDGLARGTFVWSLAGASLLLALALWGLVASAGDSSPFGAYEAFACGLLIWAWQLVTFYMGFITGPRTIACEPGMTGWPRFVEAVRTSLYHEIAAILGAIVVVALTWGAPNQIGVATYFVLWWMHQSAKLNIFFGVPNLGAELLPEHLRYLQSFMTRKPMNLLFPVSVSISTILAVLLAQRALAAQASPFEAAGYSMVATLMALAIAEHWFLVAPLPVNALWQWGVKPAPAPAVAPRAPEPVERVAPVNDDSDYPAAALAGGVESWCAHMPADCDSSGLLAVLRSVGAGAFGEVESVKGIVRTGANWVRFEAAGERASLSPFAPNSRLEPLAIAKGRRVDRARLQAALDGCSAAG